MKRRITIETIYETNDKKWFLYETNDKIGFYIMIVSKKLHDETQNQHLMLQ